MSHLKLGIFLNIQTGYVPYSEVGTLHETTSSFHHYDLPAEPPYFDGIYEEIREKSTNESNRVYIINSSLNAI
jgi:hypothetical protein